MTTKIDATLVKMGDFLRFLLKVDATLVKMAFFEMHFGLG